MRIVNIHMTGKENFKMRNRIIQVRHYSRKMMIMMLTGAICFSSCFCETAFAKTSKVRVYDVEKGTTGSHLLHIRIIKRMSHGTVGGNRSDFICFSEGDYFPSGRWVYDNKKSRQ